MPSLTKLNRSAATLTKNRTEGSVSPFSGMCVTCVDGCIGMCEIGKSAYRGHEVLYPQPFGIITAGCEKDYPVDLSHFSIMGTAKGAWGVPADSDKATFEKVSDRDQDRPQQGHQAQGALRHRGHGLDQRRQAELGRPRRRARPSPGHPDHRRERLRHGRRDRDQERPGRPLAGHGVPGQVLPGLAGKRLRRRRRPGQRRGHPARRPGIRHREAGHRDRRAQVGPGGQGHRRRGQDQVRQEGPGPEEEGLHRPARPRRPQRHRGLREGQLQGVRAPLPPGHGRGGRRS